LLLEGISIPVMVAYVLGAFLDQHIQATSPMSQALLQDSYRFRR
jgi:hypothetical protein